MRQSRTSAMERYTAVKPNQTIAQVQIRPAVPPFVKTMLKLLKRDSHEHMRMAEKPNMVTNLKFRCNSWLFSHISLFENKTFGVFIFSSFFCFFLFLGVLMSQGSLYKPFAHTSHIS